MRKMIHIILHQNINVVLIQTINLDYGNQMDKNNVLNVIK